MTVAFNPYGHQRLGAQLIDIGSTVQHHEDVFIVIGRTINHGELVNVDVITTPPAMWRATDEWPHVHTLPVDGLHVINPPTQRHATLRRIATHLGNGRGRITDHDLTLHKIFVALLDSAPHAPATPLFPHHTAPKGAERPAGWIDRTSVLDIGMVVWDRGGHLLEPGFKKRGGTIIAIEEHPHGRLFHCIDAGRWGGITGTILTSDDVHDCGERCPQDPRLDHGDLARLWRRAYKSISTGKRQLSPGDIQQALAAQQITHHLPTTLRTAA